MNKIVCKDNILIGSGLSALGFLELIKKKIKYKYSKMVTFNLTFVNF